MLPTVVAGEIRETLLDYLRTTWGFSDRAVERELFRFLEGERGIFKGPYVRVRLPFEPAPAGAVLPLDLEVGYTPHRHQLDAWRRLSMKDGHGAEPTLVVTGTGSGKTEAFLMPILDHCLRAHARGEKGIKAIILYPMNALAADQARRIGEMVWQSGDGPRGMNGKVRVGMYVGGEGSHRLMGPDHVIDVSKQLLLEPPDILLTNYKMLDFLLLRPKDRDLWKLNAPETLRYLVLDELHTYDGAQGTDVACLIRRLEARLGGKGTFCPVGTSATVTGPDGRDDSKLLRFASEIFGREFEADAIVGEHRLKAGAFFDLFGGAIEGVLPADVEALEPRAEDDIERYVARAARAWFGDDVAREAEELSRTALGARLMRHPTARALVEGASEALLTMESLDAALAKGDRGYGAREGGERGAILRSLLAMLSWSEQEHVSGTRPLVNVQVQLWVREVRRIVRAVEDEVRFAWRDEEPDGPGRPLMLPMYVCHSCGHSGWVTVGSDHDERLERDYARIGRAALQRDANVIYLHQDPLAAPADTLPGISDYLCPKCVRLGREETCRFCKGAAVGVMRHQARSQQVPPKDLQRCPACSADFSLFILGSRAATLSSVAVGHLYTTPFNIDRKLLAFSDSVQDASHRAGFFAGRTYRFTVRSAMLGVIPRDADVPITQVAQRMLAEWEARKSPGEVAAALMPRDLEYLADYQKYMEQTEARRGAGKEASALPAKLRSDLEKRLRWEVVRELGLASRVGRTLERTGCASVAVDGEVFERVVKQLATKLPARLGELEGVTAERWGWFVAGIVHRLRHRGGVWDPLLDKYFQRKGSGAYLSKKESYLLSPFAPRTSRPTFLTDEPDSERFDSLQPSRENWYTDWVKRALGLSLAARDAKDVVRGAVNEMVEAGLLLKSGRAPHAYGLVPETLVVSRRVRRLECDGCHAEHVEVEHDPASLVDATCTRYRCSGTFRAAAATDDSDGGTARDYYRRFYEKGELGRVWASEHTGLLERGYREKLEASFKERHRPDAPNMLSCTPTLEMGIDIGDLSATMLVSVPPTTASYLQRVGRAGRKTGNALVLTFTTVRPHDLYFFDEPEAAMAGAVQPPGCYLDAPEILKRHALAWCLDAWAKDSVSGDLLPMVVRKLFGGDDKRRFPNPFFEFVAANRDGLRESFLRAFDVTTGTRDELHRFFEGFGPRGSQLEQRLDRAVEEIYAEREKLRRLYRAVSDRLKALEADPKKADDYEEEHRELLHEKLFLDRELEALHDGYLLEVLCERGVLPNYAFPEEGVTLRAFIANDQGSGGAVERLKWVRSAQTAIRELAPFNTFYGMARKVRVDNIEVGSRRGPQRGENIATWQLCSGCGHMQPTAQLGSAQQCPRCGADDWRENGRRRALVKMSNVFAYARQREAAFADEAEDREREGYVSQVWLDPDAREAKDAWLNSDAKFGFELLPKVTLREINFGPERWGTTTQTVGGREVPDVAFEVCAECGQVREEDPERRRRRTRPSHRPWCTMRNKAEDKQPFERVHLLRELQSEALRLILPISMLDTKVQLPNARAAFEVGMRRYFGGDPDHLSVRLHDEPTFLSEGGRRQYLVVHDTVPGGTGVLAELAANKGRKLLDVLEAARDAIQSCGCRERGPSARGCYQCLYAYRRQDDLGVLDRDVALRLLERWIAAFPGLNPVKTISTLEMSSILESELEHRFVARLRDWAEMQDDVSMVEHAPEQWTLTVGERKWRMEPQVTLDQGHDVAIPCRPDFVLWPEGHDGRAVALFADGASYHVQAGAPRGRLADDFAKRQAIVRSGRFWVWAFAWDDVEFHGSSEIEIEAWCAREDVRAAALQVAQKVDRDRGRELLRTVLERGPLRSLLAYLRDPDVKLWQRTAAVFGVAALTTPRRVAEKAAVNEAAKRLRESTDMGPTLLSTSGEGMLWAALPVGGATARLLLSGQQTEVGEALHRPEVIAALLRLNDRAEERAERAFLVGWRAWLRAHSLLQFLPKLEVVTTEQLLPSIDAADERGDGMPRIARAADTLRTRMMTEKERSEIDGIVDEGVRDAVRRLVSDGAAVPDIPYEHGDDEAGLDIQIEVGWPIERVGIYLEEEAEMAERLRALGWTVLPASPALDEETLRVALGVKG